MTSARDHVVEMSVFDPDCLSRCVLEHATGRWGGLVLAVLVAGPMRFSEVRRAVGGVTDRMLTQTLQRLETDGLVSRTPHPTVPLRVDYDLTEIGRPIAERLCGLIEAIYEQLPAIVERQRRAESASQASP
ncbi:winged helix-turn-helix transcriptional regulator [Streptomyces sp. NPDC090499]|uniref:winged helix-turn-helix transcriptional regulator n=1 Tax=Streptomyces sp. NPDC090499 TaxID=3365965 RepID=UPI003827CFB6